MTGILMMSVGNSYGSLPVNTAAPVVSGTVQVGQTLSTTNGTWTGAPAPTFTYQWQRSGSNIGGATSSTYVIQSADVGSTLRCVVTATNAVGVVSANSNSTSTVPAITGQQEYTTAGTYSWVAPAGVTSVSVVCVGGGGGGTRLGGGGGGELRYKNNISVTPGSSYTVVVGARGNSALGYDALNATSGGNSSFNTTTCVANGGKASYWDGSTWGGIGGTGGTGDGGGSGGPTPTSSNQQGGGGAGGYSGNGGTPGTASGSIIPTAGSGGGGGGGGGGTSNQNGGGGGGGVGLLGQGANGAAGNYLTNPATGGGGGSGGNDGTAASGAVAGAGGAYGGGGGRRANSYFGGDPGNAFGAVGAVRIIWPGTTRSFPSTNTGNL